MKYRSKPQYVEAVRWDGTRKASGEILDMGASLKGNFDTTRLWAGKAGAQGWVDVPVGHWVVTDGSGDDYWPVEHDYFVTKYEAAEEQ